MRIVGGLIAGWLIMLLCGAMHHEGLNVPAFGYWPLGLAIGLGLALTFALVTPNRRTV